MLSTTYSTLHKYYITTAILIFLITGALKVSTVFQHKEYLNGLAPLIGLQWKTILPAIGCFEIVVAALTYRYRNDARSVSQILWAGCLIATYRLYLLGIDYSGPCGCFGYVGDWLGLERSQLNTTSIVILVYLIGGGLALTLPRLIGSRSAHKCLSLLLSLMISSSVLSQDLVRIDGEQKVTIVEGQRQSEVQRTTFVMLIQGTNWSILNLYSIAPGIASMQHIARHNDLFFTLTADNPRTLSGAFATPKQESILDAAPQFPRILFTTFLSGILQRETLSAAPVPFLDPSHPALHAFSWSFKTSPESGQLASIQFRIDDDAFGAIKTEELDRIFHNKSDIKRFKDSFKEGAELKLSDYSKYGTLEIPQWATLTHIHSEDGKQMARIFEVKVSSVTMTNRPSFDFRPSLDTNTWVQQLVNGEIYMYKSPGNTWMTPAEAKNYGQLKVPPSKGPKVGRDGKLLAIVVRVVLVTIAFFPLLVILFKKYKTNQHS